MLKGKVTAADDRARARFVRRYTRAPGLPKDQDEALHSEAWYRKEAARIKPQLDRLQKEYDGLIALAENAKEREAATRYQDRGLRSRFQPGTVNKVTPSEHSLETSKGRAGSNALVKAANEHNLTLRALAEAVSREVGRKVAHSHLSMMYQGRRPVSADVRLVVRRLVGFDAWPAL